MENATMGRVLVSARVENLGDLCNAMQGQLPTEQVRAIDVPEALVDTGATTLSLPKDMIEQLGLMPFRQRPARTPTGPAMIPIFGAVRLTVQGRECTCDVAELPEGSPVLIGQVPLELLDFVVDPKGHRLIGDPRHGGEQMLELY